MCFCSSWNSGRLCSCVGQPFLQNRKGGSQEFCRNGWFYSQGKSHLRFSEGFLPESLGLTLHPYLAAIASCSLLS